MIQLLATATAADVTEGRLLIAAAALLWLAGYLLACYVWPFKRCRVCEGSGKRRSPSRKAWRRCWWCRGSGERLRVGRRVWNYARRLRTEGHR